MADYGLKAPSNWGMSSDSSLGSSYGTLNTSNWTSGSSFVGANDTSQQFASALGKVGPYLAITGAIGQAFGTYYAMKSQQYQLESQSLSLEFQKDISQINARQAEFSAQKILEAGSRQAGQVAMKYGKVKSSQRVAQAAAGVVLNEGSAAEVEATTELMKQTDVLTINANTVRAAENARIQKQNYLTQGTMLGISANNAMTSANSINPYLGATTSLLGSASSIATTMYRDKVIDRLLARQV